MLTNESATAIQAGVQLSAEVPVNEKATGSLYSANGKEKSRSGW